MKIFKKIIIYTIIAFLLLMISLDSFVISYGDVSPTIYFIRLVVWVGILVALLYYQGWFVRKNNDKLKYTKTKSNIILISTTIFFIIIGFIIFSNNPAECKFKENPPKVMTLTPCEGTITTPSGHTYTGQFDKGKRNGTGIYIYSDGSKYEGEFMDGEMHGQGTFTFYDGEKYVGNYVNGKRDGQGIYYSQNGSVYEGEWKNNKPHGIGKMKYANGKIQDGEWHEGIFKE